MQLHQPCLGQSGGERLGEGHEIAVPAVCHVSAVRLAVGFDQARCRVPGYSPVGAGLGQSQGDDTGAGILETVRCLQHRVRVGARIEGIEAAPPAVPGLLPGNPPTDIPVPQREPVEAERRPGRRQRRRRQVLAAQRTLEQTLCRA